MKELKEVMELLIENQATLPVKYRNHPLQGDWKSHRDCHVRGDWILIYRLDESEDEEVVIFVRTGSHAELFE